MTDGRIWWCTSGSLNYLPIHAAAPVDSPYVQSYTSTLDALIRSGGIYESPSLETFTSVGAVQVLDSTVPRLPSVLQELDAVSQIFSKLPISQLLDSTATVHSVLEEIQKASWLHLACHGCQDPTDPLKSHLILYDGKLELGQILNTDLSSAKFVFLSACETAMGDAKLVNESMHLTGGFIAAGFRGAIGTLWSMADSDGPKVAEKVYNTIWTNGNPEVTMAAEGLHLAIQELRRSGAPLHRWVPFVHFGI